MADSTYRVGVLLDLAAGRFRRGAKAAAKDTDRLGGSLRKAAGSGSLMGRRTAEGTRGARREVQRTAQEAKRLGGTLRRTGRDGEHSMGRLTRRTKTYRTEMGLAVRAAGRLRGGLLGIAGVAGGGFAIASGLKRIVSMEQRYARLEIQAKSSKEVIERVRQEIDATANLPEIRLDPSQLLAGVEAIVEKTGDLDFARDNLVLLAQAIQGSGGTGDALGRLSSELRKLGITDPAGVAQALNLFTAQGKEGAFTIGNMASQGERLFSAFAKFKYQGQGAVRQLGALSQMARQSTGSSEQATTAVEGLLRTLSDAQKIDAIWTEFGVNVQDASGGFRPLDQIVKELIDAAGGDITRLSGIIDAEALRAISGLTTAQGRADYERFLTVEAPPDMLAQDAARMAETSGAKIQETRTDVDAWMRDKLTGPVGEVVTALTAFKDEIFVGVGLLAGSWYAFKALRSAGRLFSRLAGGGGLPRGGQTSPTRPPVSSAREAARIDREAASRRSSILSRTEAGGTGPAARPNNAWRAAVRDAAAARAREAARIDREAASRRSSILSRTEAGGTGPAARPNNAWRAAVRDAAAARAREAARIDREAASRRSSILSRTEAGGTGPAARPNNAWRAAVRDAAAARAREAARIDREAASRRSSILSRTEAGGTGPAARPNNAWRAAVRDAAAARAREAARIDREAASRRSSILSRTEAGGTGPAARPNNAWRAAVRDAAAARAREAARIDREAASRRSSILSRTEAGGTGPAARPNNAWRAAVRDAAAAKAAEVARVGREEARRRSATLTRTEPAGSGPTARPNNAWRAAVRQAAAAKAAEVARVGREEARRRSATLTRTEPAGSGPTARPNNAWRAAVRQAAAAKAAEVARVGREEARRRSATLTRTEPAGSGPTARPNNAWRAAVRDAAAARAREAARIDREAASRRSSILSRTEAGGTGPAARPNNAPATLSPTWAGGLFRLLGRGLGPASAGAVMGLTAHDIATGAIPGDQVAPEVGGLAGGLGGSWMAAMIASRLTKSLPGPIRFGGSLLAGLGGWMGGESAGRAATKEVFDPGWTAGSSENAAQWILDLIPRHDPDAPPEIGNWRGIGLDTRRANRGRLDVGRNEPEVWVPPSPPELEPGARSGGRGRLDIGRNTPTVKIDTLIGTLTVNSSAADPREVAEEVVEEIERKLRDRGLAIRDALLADPTPEAVY